MFCYTFWFVYIVPYFLAFHLIVALTVTYLLFTCGLVHMQIVWVEVTA